MTEFSLPAAAGLSYRVPRRRRWRTRLVAVPLALGALAVALSLLLRQPDVRERAALHGTRRVVTERSAGDVNLVVQGGTVVVDGLWERVEFHVHGLGRRSGAFRLDATASPRRLDLTFPLPPGSVPANGWDGVTHAVYERDGDTLRVCWMGGAVTPPQALPPGPGSPPGVILLVLTRGAD